MPRHKPSLLLSKVITSSFIFAFWNAVAKNFALPSGSSPAENPPGNIMICAFLISSAKTSTESLISWAVKFLNTLVTTLAPALSKAFVLSYSQFVPGNTGINTFGFACFSLQI